MEFVKFVLCIAVMIVVAQARAAPAGSDKQSNTEFDLPELARNGFNMTVEGTIHDKFKNNKLDLLWKDHSELLILRIEPLMKLENRATPNSFTIKIQANCRPHISDELVFKVWLNLSYVNEYATTFEDFKKVSIQGIVADIQTLHFEFKDRD